MLHETLRKQDDVVARRQAIACGMTENAIRHRIRAEGPWQIALPGVYAVGRGGLSARQRAVAAFLYAHSGIAITGMAAVVFHGLPTSRTELIDVLVPPQYRRSDAGFVRLWPTSVKPGVTFQDGVVSFGTPVRRALAAADSVAGFVDGPGLYPSLTARRNLAALAVLRGQDPRAAGIDEVLSEVGLTDVADDRVRGFSLGMRQRLGLAAALLTKPRLLVLDEPVNGLDPAGKNHVHKVLARLAGDGTGVVLSSHRMDDVEALCSEVTILSRGRVAFSGPLGKLAAGSRELDYRLLTSDQEAARRVAA